VRHGHAAQSGRTEALAREQVFGNGGAGDAAVVFEGQAGLFESSFLLDTSDPEPRFLETGFLRD
jgi:hypothetical protein